MAVSGIQLIPNIIHLRLVNKHALVDGNDGTCLQFTLRADDLDVFRLVCFKPAVRIHKLPVFIGLTDILHIIRDFFQPFLLAEHQNEAVFTHAWVAFPTVVHLTDVAFVVDDPQSVPIKLILNAASVLFRLLDNGIVPFRHVVNRVNDLLDMLRAKTVFREVGAIVFPFVARVAHNAKSVSRAVMLNGLEADAHVLPTPIKVLTRQSRSVGKLVAFVLIVNLVVLVFLRQSEKTEIEHSRAVFGLLDRGQGNAFQNSVVQIHIEGDCSIAAKV